MRCVAHDGSTEIQTRERCAVPHVVHDDQCVALLVVHDDRRAALDPVSYWALLERLVLSPPLRNVRSTIRPEERLMILTDRDDIRVTDTDEELLIFDVSDDALERSASVG